MWVRIEPQGHMLYFSDPKIKTQIQEVTSNLTVFQLNIRKSVRIVLSDQAYCQQYKLTITGNFSVFYAFNHCSMLQHVHCKTQYNAIPLMDLLGYKPIKWLFVEYCNCYQILFLCKAATLKVIIGKKISFFSSWNSDFQRRSNNVFILQTQKFQLLNTNVTHQNFQNEIS